ncbi:acetate--CoA ligase family protein [Chloroflexota bacterium]
MIELAKQERKMQLTEIESKELVKEAGIPVVGARLARNKKEAISLSKEDGFPVVLKIVSPDIIHKSDMGGVKLGLQSATQVKNAYSEIMQSISQFNPNARIQDVSVQKMVPPGIEVIIGMSKDAQFGPVLMFGLGGILVEMLKDVSFRIVPVTRKDAGKMIREIKGYPLLQGYRGQEPVDITFLEGLIVKVSELCERRPDIRELDLNPIFAYQDGAVAVDARIVLDA